MIIKRQFKTRNSGRINADSNRDEEVAEKERDGTRGKSCWTAATRRSESNDLVIVPPREVKDLR